MKKLNRAAAAIALAVAASAATAAPVRNIVLVHGFFADGSGWRGVADILTRDGFNVSVVQEPQTSLADDVAATTRAVDAVDGSSILVGHSYGASSLPRRATTPKSPAWCTSPHSRRTQGKAC